MTQDRAEAWRGLSTAVAATQSAFEELRRESIAQFDAIRAGDRPAVLAHANAIDRQHDALAKSLNDVRDVLDDTIKSGREASQQTYDDTRLSILLGLIWWRSW